MKEGNICIGGVTDGSVIKVSSSLSGMECTAYNPDPKSLHLFRPGSGQTEPQHIN